VHTFETLQVLGKADVDFGGDRVIVNDVDNSRVTPGSTLRAGQAQERLLELGARHRVAGHTGNGLKLSGDGQKVVVGQHADFGELTALTLSAWINVPNAALGNYNQEILASGYQEGVRLVLSTNGYLHCQLQIGSEWRAYNTGVAVPSGRWVHTACTWDGNVMRIYVDGVLKKSASGLTGTIPESSKALQVGALELADYPGGYFKGTIDTVRFHRVALTDPMDTTTTDGRVLAYDFEDAGLTITDTSGREHHGLLVSGGTPLAGTLLIDDVQFDEVLDLGNGQFEAIEFNHPVAVENLSILHGQATFHAGLTVAGDLALDDTNVIVHGEFSVGRDLTLTGGSRLDVDGIAVENLVAHGSTLITDTLSTTGNVDLLNGAVVTVPAADAGSKTVHVLDIDVAGTLSIDGTSMIDLNGKGYASSYWSGPDFSADTRRSCHAGVRSNANGDCTYGRHEHARFGGSAGRWTNADHPAQGGGVAAIRATHVVLNGTIRANGLGGYYWDGNGGAGGAGGGIHIDTESLSGVGSLQTNGAGNLNNISSGDAAGGGRISVVARDRSGFGRMEGGVFDAYAGFRTIQGYGNPAGAGTVYLKSPDAAYGHLVVDNGNRTSKASGTPIRAVGRHVITGVDQTSAGVWRIEVNGTPWRMTDVAHDWGLDGIDVDLDASNATGPLYRIVRNTANTLTVHTADDLGGLIGRELIGVHTFETLQVLGKADVDFGGDRVIVNDVDNSRVTPGSTLRAGQVSANLLDTRDGYRVAGISGNGMHLPEKDWSIEVGEHADFNALSQLTLAAWVKPSNSALGRDQYIVDHGNTLGFGLRLVGDGRPVCNIYSGYNGYMNLYGNDAIPSGEWTHLACTYDGAQFRIYVNGVEHRSYTTAQNISNGGTPLRIGVESHTSIGNNYFGGSLDSIRIHRVALADPTDTTNTEELVLAYDFEGTGLEITDTSGRGHHGLLIAERGELSGRLVVDDIDLLSSLNLGATAFTTLEINSEVDISNLALSYGNIVFHGGLRVRNDFIAEHAEISVANNFTIGGDLQLTSSLLTSPYIAFTNGEMDDAALNAGMVVADQDFTARNGSTLVIDTLEAGGNIQLLSNSTLTVPDANATGRFVHELDVSAGGVFTLDDTSIVDLNGKGYSSSKWSGPDFTQNGRDSCHGGTRSGTTGDCTYGRYEEASFAGSAGSTWYSSNTGAGGGFGRFIADAIILDGKILANGISGYDGGAGGGVHIAAREVSGTGTGRITVNGGYGCCRYVGGGGRISVFTESTPLHVAFEARGGVNGNTVGGAGTVFLKSPLDAEGHLVVNNGDYASGLDGTPMRQVGRHVVELAEANGDGEWRITVGGAPWLATDTQHGWGLDGLQVDLDAADLAGPRYRIVRNEENVLIVQTADDLSSSAGKELVGVHQMKTLTVSGRADVQFGDDVVVVTEPGGLQVDAGSNLRAAHVIAQ